MTYRQLVKKFSPGQIIVGLRIAILLTTAIVTFKKQADEQLDKIQRSYFYTVVYNKQTKIRYRTQSIPWTSGGFLKIKRDDGTSITIPHSAIDSVVTKKMYRERE